MAVVMGGIFHFLKKGYDVYGTDISDHIIKKIK